MTLTAPPPSARTVRGFQSTPAAPVVSSEGTRAVVTLYGEADFAIRPLLSDVLLRVLALRSGDVVIDLAQVEFIDTGTVRALALCRLLLDRNGRNLSFRSSSRLATRVLALFGLTDLIEAREARP
jgi:anti-anti-sigma factor